jgi:guanosine-3',5'-bis(diphosphate) 3'-pyrophosphohydrolase
VGDRCIGAKINGRIAPLNTKLQNGDQVEIVTAKTQNPSPTWERFVVTGKARSHIRRFIRQQQSSEYLTLGRAMLQKVFKSEGYEFTEKAVTGVVDQFRECKNNDDVFIGIGAGNIVARDVFKAIFPAHKNDADSVKQITNPEDLNLKNSHQERSGKTQPMPIKGLIPGMAVHYARCCHPTCRGQNCWDCDNRKGCYHSHH